MPLLLAVMFFAACVLDHDQRLRIMAAYVEKAAKRLFGVPDFKYYAVADGLRSLFSRNPGKPERPSQSTNVEQHELWAEEFAQRHTTVIFSKNFGEGPGLFLRSTACF